MTASVGAESREIAIVISLPSVADALVAVRVYFAGLSRRSATATTSAYVLAVVVVTESLKARPEASPAVVE